MARSRIVKVKLTCPKCERIAFALLMENSQGMYKVNTYLCATDLAEMERSVPNDNSEQSGNDEAVG